MNGITRGMRNAFRNAIRTFSIVVILALSIGLAITMLIARQAVQTKINSVKSSIGNTITISPAGARGFEGGGNPLTTTELAGVKTLPHVTAVVETLSDRLTSTQTNLQSAIAAGSLGQRFNGGGNAGGGGSFGGNGGAAPTQTFTPPVFVTGANSLDGSILNGGGSVTLTSGSKFDPTQDVDVALIGKSLATKNNLAVGSTFTAYGATMKVAGIFDAGNTFSNNAVVLPLPTEQRLSAQAGDISSATAQVDSIDNLASTTTAIQTKLDTSVADVVSEQDTSNQALAPLQNIKTISLYSLVGAVVAGAVIILLTMMMIVRERRREIGVLKAIGSSNLKVMTQFMTEALTFTVLAAVIGLGVGVAAGSPVTNLLVTTSSSNSTTSSPGVARGGGGSGGFGGAFGGGFGRGAARAAGLGGQSLHNLQATVGWGILLDGLGAALVIALLGSAIPALLIAKVRPAEVMRVE